MYPSHVNYLFFSAYSAKFALRSYLYLLLHAIVAGPASLWYGAGGGKVPQMDFYPASLLSLGLYACYPTICVLLLHVQHELT